METSAPKRRKTSPNSNVPVDRSDATASSDGATRRSTRRRRPSFASPTKSSLSRANPEILERRNATRAQSQASATAADNARPNTTGNNDDESDQLTAQLEGASENRPTSEPIEPENADALSQAAPGNPTRRSLGGMAARPRRTPNKPSPRPLPPPSMQEEELLDPFKGRVLRRSPPRGVLPVYEAEEPELPPTPTEKGMSNPAAFSTSPMGSHNTPSKRPRRSRALAEKIKSGSSPLKHPPLRPDNLGTSGKQSWHTLLNTSQVPSNTSHKGPDRTRSENTLGKALRARRALKSEPFAEKKTLRESLLAEVAQLEADLGVVRKENNRLQDFKQPRFNVPVRKSSAEKAALVDLLRRHALPSQKGPPPDPSQAWLVTALYPVSFLPFGNPSLTIPDLFKRASTPEDDDRPPRSHHPVPLTATEELPYLQLFTSLTFTSTVSLLPRDPDEFEDPDAGPLMQKHSISVSSTPRGLFAARIEMLVNTKTLSVSELSVPSLDSSSAAELGPFLAKILDDEGRTNSALRRNITVLTWAMNEWTRLATKRARFWWQIAQELGTRDGVLRCSKKMRTGKRRRRGRRTAVRSHEEETDEDDEDEDNDKNKGGLSKADLLSHLGRTSLELDLGNDDPRDVTLRIEWKIGFDWTGEGTNKIGVLVQAPRKWHGIDDRGSLAGIPQLFDKLVQGGGEPLEAVRTVAALLVGEGEE